MLFLVITAAPRVLRASQSTSHCPNSTVEDAWGPEVAARAKTFLSTLQKVVESNDSAGFARLVHYPVRVIDAGRVSKITTRSALARKFPALMTANVREAILKQSQECLFGNDQGVMIGNGQVWFQPEPSGKMKIITINLTSP
jgi:hypothetical protein